jgi:hypothetical protein
MWLILIISSWQQQEAMALAGLVFMAFEIAFSVTGAGVFSGAAGIFFHFFLIS